MKRVKVRWEVTEVHEAVIEVPDDFDGETGDNVDEYLSSDVLAEREDHDDKGTYQYTSEREWQTWDLLDETVEG